jgi:hypothetical protein
MSKTQNTADALAAFLAKGGQITKCEPGEANARSLRQLRKDVDRAIENGQSANVLARRNGQLVNPAEEIDAEQAAEIYVETATQARLCGADASEALETARIAVSVRRR